MSDELEQRRDPATGEPLRPGAHGRYEPFKPGHLKAMTHGSYLSELRLSTNERVAELAEAIRETQPVAHPADEGAVQRLALVYWRLEVSTRALDDADQSLRAAPLNAYVDKSAWLERLRGDHDRWHRLAGRIEEQLARTPASRARLGLHLALATRTMTVVELHEAAALEGQTVEDEGE